MNLSDQEILELHELCNAVVDGTIREAQHMRLSRWLAESEAARELYVRALGLSASLHSYASEMLVEAPDGAAPEHKIASPWFRRGLGLLAIAAAIVFLLWVVGRPDSRRGTHVKVEESIAQLTGSR